MIDVMQILGQKNTAAGVSQANAALCAADITVIQETDVYTQEPKLDDEGKEIFHAFLGFIPYSGIIQQPPKYYRATASSPEAAKHALISALKEQLDKAINTQAL